MVFRKSTALATPLHFLRRFPTVRDVAAASEARIRYVLVDEARSLSHQTAAPLLKALASSSVGVTEGTEALQLAQDWLTELLTGLDRSISDLESRLPSAVADLPEAAVLMTFPYMSPIRVATLLAGMGAPSRPFRATEPYASSGDGMWKPSSPGPASVPAWVPEGTGVPGASCTSSPCSWSPAILETTRSNATTNAFLGGPPTQAPQGRPGTPCVKTDHGDVRLHEATGELRPRQTASPYGARGRVLRILALGPQGRPPRVCFAVQRLVQTHLSTSLLPW